MLNDKFFVKTELMLKDYKKYLLAVRIVPNNAKKTKELIGIIEQALRSIEDDPYYSIIEMFYFENKTREQIAEFYDVEEKTITRNKKRLVNVIKTIIFADESINKILFSNDD